MILIVDDEALVRSALKALIGRSQKECIEAADGVEALQILSQSTPELIILDYRMPGIDGIEVLRSIRNSPRLRGVRVLMHTSDSSRIKNLALQIGADAVIAKGSIDSWTKIIDELEMLPEENSRRFA